MILIDTSVLVRYLRTRDAAIARVLAANRIAVSVVTRAEILHGARDETDWRRLTTALDAFVQIGVDGGADCYPRDSRRAGALDVRCPFQAESACSLGLKLVFGARNPMTVGIGMRGEPVAPRRKRKDVKRK